MSQENEVKKEKLKIRRNKKAALTRSLNILSSSTDAKHEKEVIEKAMEKLQTAFSQLEEVHEALADLIIDEEEFTQAENYMETCQREYTQGLQTGTKYLTEWNERVKKDETEERPVDSDQPDKSVHEVARFMLKKDLMTNGLVKFDDDPMNYRQWKTTFKGVIEELKLSPREESDLLIRWLGTKSTKSMMRLRAVYSNDQTTGLRAIWERLDEEYGAAELIEGLLISKLETFPKIGRDQPVKLREFADFLCELQAAKNDASLSGLAFLDTSKGVGMAVETLPFTLQEGWRNTGSKYKEDKGVTFPPFKVFVDYISKQAKVRNDPSFRPPQIQPKSSQSPSKSSQARSFSSCSIPTKQKGCVCCSNADHWIDECDRFKTMSLNERDQIVRAKGLCRGCLKRGHIWRNCMRRQTCGICKGPHPTILHLFQGEKATTSPGKEVHTTVTHSHCNRLDTTDEGDCVSSIVPVMVKCDGSEVLTYAMLDEQSDACFMTDALKGKLGASGTDVNLEISTILSQGTVSSVRIKGLTVKGLNQTEVIKLPATYTREVIPVAASQIPTQGKIKDWAHLQRVRRELSPLLNVEVGLLIGATCPQALTPLEVIPGRRETDPYAIRTKLGWSVVGVASQAECSVKTRFAFRTTTKEVLRVLERDFIDLENDETSMSVNDARFLDVLNKGVEKVDGHFQLPLPFKFNQPKLPNNRGVALKRLDHLKTKLTKDKKYAEQYKKFMKHIVEEGQAERVPEEEQPSSLTWYIPHHGVYHPRKKDKLRVVLDCASRYQGVSLNEVLLQGPNLTNSLTGVLLRFRQERIAVVGDIEGMFYQVRVAPDDRDYLRYLWWDDGDLSREPHDYRMKVHVFGAASSPGCANYALKKTAEMYEDQYGSDAADFVRRGFYVDDGLVSVSTPDEALSLTTRTVAMLKEGGFRLHKLISNSKEVLQALPKDAIASTCGMLDLSDLPTERTLGILWNAEKDKFQFEAALKDRPSTRRGILSTVSAVFDPLGFLGPYVLTGKRILQRLCVSGTDWDEEVDEDILNEWNNWKKQLAFLKEISIDRCQMPGSSRITTVELHHFSDASEKGYGQCSYLRLVDDHGNIKVSLLISKCRVSPSKVTTIPRLELMAATVSVQLATLLRKELKYDGFSEHFWTDSKVVLGYINNEARRFHTFVANRIQQIRNSSNPKQWHYVPSQENPADIASRGLDAERLKECSMWWNGPEFLSQPDYVIEGKDYGRIENDVEVKKSRVFAAQVKIMLIPEVLERMSSWTKARRVLARCLIFISKLKKTRTSEKITVDDLMKAEKLMIKLTQGNEFSDLTNLTKLNPMIGNDGLIRVGGRLKKSNLPQEIKHPVILPARSDLTRLIVSHYHDQVHHQGRGITLNAIRAAGFWIIGGVSTVTRYIFRCVLCRRLRRDPEVQKMADLPADRLEPAPTFTYSGVDYFGPFIARNGRKEEKRYGVIFTCLVTRSVHLEVANSLSTDSFLNAFRRFICRRGAVRQLRSDRGTNFVGAEAELQKALKEMDQPVLQDELLKLHCDWVFNTPTASHHGGAWERMIRTTRSILNSIMFQHKALFNDEMLNTFMAEAEAIINSRPLTTTNEASVEPLTPAHLLTLKNSVVMPPPGKCVHNDKFSRMRWRRVQHLAEEFWCRWKKEYVANLQLRQRWTTKKRNMKEGDIVLLCEENTPRNQWQLSKVVKVQPSDDGLVRKVSVFVGSRKTTLDRPVNKLILLVPVEETQ